MPEFDRKSVTKKNEVLLRNILNSLEGRDINVYKSIEEIEDLHFFRIKGISNFWETQEKLSFDSLMADIITGINKYNISFSYIVLGTGKYVEIFIGISKAYAEVLQTSIRASYSNIVIEKSKINNIQCRTQYGGIVTGYPTNKTLKEKPVFQVERLCQGMVGKDWVYMVIARGLSPIQTSLTHQKLLNELNDVNSAVKYSESTGIMGSQTIERVDFGCQNYFQNLNALVEKIKIGTVRGFWRVCTYYAAPDAETANYLKNIIKSIYSGEDSKPEPIRCINLGNISHVIQNFGLISDELLDISNHPAGKWNENGRNVDCFKFMYQSILNSDDLSTFCQILRKEFPGYFVNGYVEFEVDKRRNDSDRELLDIGTIITPDMSKNHVLKDNEKKYQYSLEIDDLTRHGLIIGITGGGKTNTSKAILSELWVNHKKPFMVIESAKREYWELYNLYGFDDLLIFTLGSEDKNSIPYRINPFEVVPGISLQTHIDYLFSTFKASFELYPPMPYVLESCIYEVYADRGWDVLNNMNTFGRSDYPTLEDLYHKIDAVVDRLGYDKRIQSDVKAALKARVNSLRIGGKGAMLDTSKSVPIEKLLTKPVVMELEDIGDDDVKAFVIGIILVQLYEYRRSNGSNKNLLHVILVEEAHRLLKNVSTQQGGEAANPRGKAVEFFCNLLAEIRSYGQGILIADQVPTKLAPDTLKNTNLKITHRIVMKEDREVIGGAMNMTPEQIEYLSTLKRGYAAVYSEGDNRPKMVNMPHMIPISNNTREKIVQIVKEKLKNFIGNYEETYKYGPACFCCVDKCIYYKQINDWIISKKLLDKNIKEWAETLNFHDFKWLSLENCFKYIENKKVHVSMPIGMRICFLNFLLNNTQYSYSEKRGKVTSYIKKYYEYKKGEV